MLVFNYQHTCKTGHSAYLLANTPFFSPKRKQRNGKFKIPFLGEGYYFWEENEKAAHTWGKNHYQGKYNIVEFVDLEIPKDLLLDFGNRRDISYFKELRDMYMKKRPQSKSWSISVWIEFFKTMKKKEEILFPYNYIRADENYPDEGKNSKLKEKIIFAFGEKYFTYLEPLLVLCVLDKSSMKFVDKKVIH